MPETKPGFAFPFGTTCFDGEKDKKLAAACGFSYAAMSVEGVNTNGTDIFQLRRISMEDIPLHVTMFCLTGLRGRLKKLVKK